MNRKEFFHTGAGCCALALFGTAAKADGTAPASALDPEKEFVKNWLEDLFAAMDTTLDEQTKVKVMAGCGVGCFRRHSFKTDIAKLGKGNLDNLLAAYKKNFEVWREGDKVHVRYGAEVKQCYCPASRFHPIRPNDMHCECTRATHQAIFETALERPIKVEVVESLRRGGRTCHFVATVA